MSLRSMAVMRAEGDAGTPSDEQKKLRDQLIALMPAEAVGLYVAAIGAAAEAPEWVRWLIFAVVLLFTPGWVLVNYWEQKGGRKGVPVPKFELGVGVVAFIAWTTTVPRGTFDDLGWPVWAGTIVVAVVAAGLTLAVRAEAVWAKKPAGGGDPPPPQPAPTPAV